MGEDVAEGRALAVAKRAELYSSRSRARSTSWSNGGPFRSTYTSSGPFTMTSDVGGPGRASPFEWYVTEGPR